MVTVVLASLIYMICENCIDDRSVPVDIIILRKVVNGNRVKVCGTVAH